MAISYQFPVAPQKKKLKPYTQDKNLNHPGSSRWLYIDKK
jgi:hypothetical protein